LFTPEAPVAKATGLAAAVRPAQSAPITAVTPPRLLPPHGGAYMIAEKIAATWNKYHRAGDITVPMGVIASLALLRQTALDGHDTTGHVLSLNPADLITFYKEVWAHTWMMNPYLASCTYELWSWMLVEETPGEVLTVVHALTRTAVTSGMLILTGDADPAWRCEHDMLGALLTTLRSPGRRDVLAEFHTPPEVANLMARIGTLEVPEPGGSFDDPTAGTGGLLRAAALTLRLHGADPHDYGWSMGEIDSLAAACCAVNAIIWSLGPNVLIFHGDTLATGNGPDRAIEHRHQAWTQHRALMRDITMAKTLMRIA